MCDLRLRSPRIFEVRDCRMENLKLEKTIEYWREELKNCEQLNTESPESPLVFFLTCCSLLSLFLLSLSLSPIARIHLLVLIQSSLRLDKFKESSVIHSLGLSTCCAVSRASAKDIFGAVRTKSGFGGNYCTKDASNFHCISIILCIIILIIFIIIFFHRCFLLSGSGSKLKSHFAFNWYSLTPQKRPNKFDVKTF